MRPRRECDSRDAAAARPWHPRRRAARGVASACTAPRATGAARLLVRGGGPDPDSLDPQKARGFEAQSIVRDLCEGLTTLDQQRRRRARGREPAGA